MPKFKVVALYKDEVYSLEVQASNEASAKQLAIIRMSHSISNANAIEIKKVQNLDKVIEDKPKNQNKKPEQKFAKNRKK